MTAQPTPEMCALADQMSKWRGLSAMGASEVLIWWRTPKIVGVALRGDALRIENFFRADDGMMWVGGGRHYRSADSRCELDRDLQHLLGVQAGVRMGGGDDKEHFSTVLDGAAAVVSHALFGDVDEAVTVNLMPNEGEPWVPGSAQTPYYSSKKHKVLVTKRPEWAITIKYREPGDNTEVNAWAANVCDLVGPIESQGTGILGVVSGRQFFASHSFNIGGRGQSVEAQAAAINKCGGLIFPSIAVGQIPANIFGVISLFADVRMALGSVRPFKTRGRYPVVLYASDAWTENTTGILGQFAVVLFRQLTGNYDWSIYGSPHMNVLGPEVLSDAGALSDRLRLVDSTSRLASILAKRGKIWGRDADAKATCDRYWDKPERYPYIEAKVNAKVPISCFPVAAAPVQMKKEAAAFLKKIGFVGALVLVNTPVPLADIVERADDQAVYRYAWAVRDAVASYADEHRMVMPVVAV